MTTVSASSLVLASSSPRRREILESLGLSFEVRVADVDERQIEGESPADMVVRLAKAKADAVSIGTDECVLGADTAVVLGERIFGKPTGIDDALNMLRALSGKTHRVVTGVVLRTAERSWSALSSTDVQFREISPDEAGRYWQSGESCDKAGAYAIQGRGGTFVRAIMGSYSGVVGLPVYETAELLRHAGLNVLPAPKRRA